MGFVVSLTEEEQFRCFKLANQRNNKSIRSNHFGSKSSFQIHYEGLLAELAVAKAFGVDVDTTIYRNKGDGGKPDLHLPSDIRAQVKYRDRKGWDLAMTDGNPEFDGDVAILVWPHDEDSVEIAGWISREQFIAKHFVTNYLKRKGAERAAVRSEDLEPIEDLLQRCGVAD